MTFLRIELLSCFYFSTSVKAAIKWSHHVVACLLISGLIRRVWQPIQQSQTRIKSLKDTLYVVREHVYNFSYQFLADPRPSDCDKRNRASDKLLLFYYCHSCTMTLTHGAASSQQFKEQLSSMLRVWLFFFFFKVSQYGRFIVVGLFWAGMLSPNEQWILLNVFQKHNYQNIAVNIFNDRGGWSITASESRGSSVFVVALRHGDTRWTSGPCSCTLWKTAIDFVTWWGVVVTNDLLPAEAHETLDLLTHLWHGVFKSMELCAVDECVETQWKAERNFILMVCRNVACQLQRARVIDCCNKLPTRQNSDNSGPFSSCL